MRNALSGQLYRRTTFSIHNRVGLSCQQPIRFVEMICSLFFSIRLVRSCVGSHLTKSQITDLFKTFVEFIPSCLASPEPLLVAIDCLLEMADQHFPGVFDKLSDEFQVE